jgi:hypothetical protein
MNNSSTGLSRHDLHGATPLLTVTVATARKLSGLGNTTIWELIKNRKLETVCVGRRRLIVYRSLERLLSPESPDTSLQRRQRGRPPKVATPDEGVRDRKRNQLRPRKRMIDAPETVA